MNFPVKRSERFLSQINLVTSFDSLKTTHITGFQCFVLTEYLFSFVYFDLFTFQLRSWKVKCVKCFDRIGFRFPSVYRHL